MKSQLEEVCDWMQERIRETLPTGEGIIIVNEWEKNLSTTLKKGIGKLSVVVSVFRPNLRYSDDGDEFTMQIDVDVESEQGKNTYAVAEKIGIALHNAEPEKETFPYFWNLRFRMGDLRELEDNKTRLTFLSRFNLKQPKH